MREKKFIGRVVDSVLDFSRLIKLLPRGPFPESPENFSGPKSHSLKCDLLIL